MDCYALAADMLAEMDPADAVMWLEDRLAGTDDEGEAAACCDLIDAVMLISRRRVH